MAEALSSEAWARLRQDRPSHEDAYATEKAAEDPCGRDIFIGVDSRSDIHLLVPVDGPSDGEVPPDLQGLRIRHQILSNNSSYIDLSAGAAHERLFSSLAAAVLRAVVDDAREPWKAVVATVDAWRSAWKPVPLQMTKTAQVGLFGELMTLEHIMLPALGTQSVHWWSGPEMERHDFVGTAVHVEVKTTRKSRPEHEISRLDQLNTVEGRRLLLVSIQLEETVGGRETVGTKMKQIVEMLRDDAAATDLFMAKMRTLGWNEELPRSGQLLRFNVRDTRIFEVDESFPRLPQDFIPPDGVVSLRYTIDLANVPSIGKREAIDVICQQGRPSP